MNTPIPKPNESQPAVEKQNYGDKQSPGALQEIWRALAQTPGIGVSITDSHGKLLFVNNTSLVMFSGDSNIDYLGKSISDFHPPKFVEERLALIQRVLKENKPLSIDHIYNGRRICSTVWPIRDHTPPYDRVLVVSRPGSIDALEQLIPSEIETIETSYIDLGPLSVLTRRELEVAVLLGHGLTVPKVAATLHRSPKTIERHREAIGKKLSMHSQSELVHLITCMGLELKHIELQRY